jgi:putative lipoic acid-binding regulatory protein
MPVSNNGKPTNGNKLMEKAKLEFPLKFQLKAVIVATESDKENKMNLESVFNELEVEYSYINNKVSSKRSYVSYNYEVTLLSKTQLEKLYVELKNVRGLKFAL